MANGDNSHLKHLIVNFTPHKDNYRSPKIGRSKELNLASRNRDDHGKKLKEQLEQIQSKKSELDQLKENFDFKGDYGVYVEFASEENFELKVESLERLRSGIEVQNVRELNGITYATVYIPEGKIKNFFNIVDKYLAQNVKNKDIPKNKELVESISEIKLATLKAFWTDFENFDDIPDEEEKWWELWLRHGKDIDEKEIIFSEFTRFIQENNIQLSATKLTFPERTIVLVKTNKKHLRDSISLLNCLAEVKLPHDSPEDFMQMTLEAQSEWVEDLIRRTSGPSDLSPAICILDSGINRAHRLIQNALDEVDMHSYNPTWGVNDLNGHGTRMAGLALYGDLYEVMVGGSNIDLRHRLESVKMYLNPSANPPELFGDITQSCIARAEIQAPLRKRIICLAISSKEKRYSGIPSSWSSALDQTTYNEQDEFKRLIIVAGGNLEFWQLGNYPNENKTESIHDPGQSWNAITVGAMTYKNVIDQSRWPNFSPVAPIGGLCPTSTTSCTWESKWPLKPDLVFEGGNLGRETNSNDYDYLDSLQLLTTHHQHLSRMFAVFGDTSAATALVSRLAALLSIEYPTLWPESIRALLINSANWTDSMLNGYNIENLNQVNKNELLRMYGYGVANSQRAIWSLRNNLTLIYQDSLKPFIQDGSDIKTNEINYHNLPLPSEILRELGGADVELKITLSYFIEPNPSNRKYFGKYDYQSCGLRFDIKKGTEDVDEFKGRMNLLSREKDEVYQGGLNWLIGSTLRNRGSIHSDIWKGTAAALAEMNLIAVYPVTGWWRTRKQLKKWENVIRYSLIVSINIENIDIDIYTPISNQINVPVSIS